MCRFILKYMYIARYHKMMVMCVAGYEFTPVKFRFLVLQTSNSFYSKLDPVRANE